MGSARNAERAFFPLDQELGVLPGTLTPSLQEDLVRLGAWMPFGRAAQALQHFRLVDVSRPRVERLTETAGAAYVAYQAAETERIQRDLPKPPTGPAQQFLSVDGAMVPLVGGEWAEVKTLVIGDVSPPVSKKGEVVVHTLNHSYFSRLSDAGSFQVAALVETHRRGVETAQAVGAVTDGSEWIQKFLDQHRHDALRILDFPHAAGHLTAIGQAVFGEGSAQAQGWLAEQMHRLKHDGPTSVLATVRDLVEPHPQAAVLATHLAYLEKRTAHMQYPAFQAAGWPIGDGAVESGNKLVVEVRLKGSGMHWRREHVDALLALPNIVCSDRWAEAWPQIAKTLRQQTHQQRTARHEKRRQVTTPSPAVTASPAQPQQAAPASTAPNRTATATPQPAASQATLKTTASDPWRPPANHPWRHLPVGRAHSQSPRQHSNAKL